VGVRVEGLGFRRGSADRSADRRQREVKVKIARKQGQEKQD